MDRRALSVLAAAALWLLAAPAGAAAATVEVKSVQRVSESGKGPPITYTEYLVVYTAAPGELNEPFFYYDLDGMMVRDRFAGLTPGAMCSDAGGGAVLCKPPARPVLVQVALGDRDDELEPNSLHKAGISAAVDAGPGDDEVDVVGGSALGGEGNDRLTGGDPSDALDGGPGEDTVEGNGGNDTIVGGPGGDRMNGGAGIDTVSWAGETAPVTVDLAADPEGTPEGLDRVALAESAIGGAGDDVLLGTEGTNALSGGPGNDRLDGRGGHDDLRGEQGDDAVDGGAGNDFMNADTYGLDDAGADTLDGGPGNDRVRGALGPDQLLGGEGDDLVEAPAESRRVDGGAGNDTFEFAGFGHTPPRAAWRGLALSCGAGDDGVQGLQVPAMHPRDCEMAILDGDEEIAVSTRLRRVRGRLRVPVPSGCAECRARVELRDSRGRKLSRRRFDPRRATIAFRIDRRLRRALRRPALEVRFRFGSVGYRLRLPAPRR